METKKIVSKIKALRSKHLVITGGEPMIQQKGLQELLEKLTGYFVEIETNGGFETTIDQYIHQYNCSPKLKGSGNKPYHLKILPNKKTWYKFVIDSKKDLDETLVFIRKNKIPPHQVRLMPQGETREKSIKKSKWLIKKCQQYGFIFNPRIHVLIWDNQRGK